MTYLMAGQLSEPDRLIEAARKELADPRRWAVTFTLVQAWSRAQPSA